MLRILSWTRIFWSDQGIRSKIFYLVIPFRRICLVLITWSPHRKITHLLFVQVLLLQFPSEITPISPLVMFPRFLLVICLKYQKISTLLHSKTLRLVYLPTTRYTQSIHILQPPLSLTLILPPIQYQILSSATPRSINRSGVVYSTTKKVLRTSRGTMTTKTTGASPRRTGLLPCHKRNLILC